MQSKKTKINKESIKNAVTFLGQSKIKCPGLTWDRKKQYGDGELDIEIIPLLQEINKLDFLHTVASCAGHSAKELENPKKGWGINIPYRINIALHVKAKEINTFTKLIYQFYEIMGNIMWCELGYGEDLNNKTESGYIPFQIVIFAETKKKRDSCLEKLYQITKSKL